MVPRNTVVVDNGASTIKIGISGYPQGNNLRIVSNAIVRSKGDKRTYFGHELDQCTDHASLHYRLPFEKGYIVDWDAEKAIWDGIFSEEVLRIDPQDFSLLITEPYFNLPSIQEVYDQFVFEEYEFQAYHRCSPASLVPHGQLFAKTGLHSPECMLIVDSGFSFTHVIPIINHSIQWNAVKRIDVGGKLLTNHLKELVSFRQWNMMDETYVMNEVKETCCYVSRDFGVDLEICRSNSKKNTIIQEYVLPDFSSNRRGHVRNETEISAEGEQVLYMGSERFSVPEILFRPDDIGLPQSGISATVADSIALLPPDLHGLFWANIGLIGGNTKFPGFPQRLLDELRSLAPVDCEVTIYPSSEPALEAYHSALAFAQHPHFSNQCVTREEYLESGSNACRRKFKDWQDVAGGGSGGGSGSNAGRETGKTKGKGRPRDEDSDDGEDSPPSVPAKTIRTRTRTVSAVKRR